MKKIDTTQWGEFLLGNLFIVEKGKRLTKANMKPGNINYIGATAFDNGITAHIANNEHLHPAGTITVCYNGSVGQTFYQTTPYWATDDVNVLYPRFEMKPQVAFFIIPILRTMGQKYAFVDKWTKDKMENTKILLPRDAEGNPDWAYMEEYMKALEKRVTNSVTALNTLLGGGKHYSRIDVSKWQYFKVGKLFEIHPTKAYKLTNAQLLDNGQYPVVVNSAFNNGVGGYSSQTPTEQGNMITFSDTVDANTIFYQAEKFVGYPHVQGLYPLSYKEQWTANSLKFFASVFRKAALTKGFDYGNKFRRDIATEIEIKLPTTANGDPDFEYMEQYMLNVENKVKGTLKQIA